MSRQVAQMQPSEEFGIWEAVDVETGRRVFCGSWEYGVWKAARARGYEVRHWPPRTAEVQEDEE